MERIGIAASKIAKGNLLLYNGYVILISFLLLLFLFVMVGSTVLFALIIIDYIVTEVAHVPFHKNRSFIYTVCMITLGVIMGIFHLVAVFKNIKFKKDS
ncbi:MAG: hypothetical protein KC618_04450 [Candidatus Omnitrophica bacterium]|nr:hypothetical protein [Candidatus Omnitrophota bacterium]